MWFEHLSEEDLAFVKRFLLASGSLKELAEAYGISYPTVRLRLDRLIEKIRILGTLKTLLREHRRELEARHEKGVRAR
jgi:hypothetical protein